MMSAVARGAAGAVTVIGRYTDGRNGTLPAGAAATGRGVACDDDDDDAVEEDDDVALGMMKLLATAPYVAPEPCAAPPLDDDGLKECTDGWECTVRPFASCVRDDTTAKKLLTVGFGAAILVPLFAYLL